MLDERAMLATARTAVGAYLTRHPHLNRDYDLLLSDALYGVAQCIARFDPSRGPEFGAYAYRRAQGAIIDGIRVRDGIRRQGDEPVHLGDLDGDELPVFCRPERGYAAAEARAVIHDALSQLPAELRELVIRVDLNDEEQRAVAADLGVSDATVSLRRKEARRLMAAHIGALPIGA